MVLREQTRYIYFIEMKLLLEEKIIIMRVMKNALNCKNEAEAVVCVCVGKKAQYRKCYCRAVHMKVKCMLTEMSSP